MEWALKNRSGVNDLLEYEARARSHVDGLETFCSVTCRSEQTAELLDDSEPSPCVRDLLEHSGR